MIDYFIIMNSVKKNKYCFTFFTGRKAKKILFRSGRGLMIQLSA